MSLGHGAGIVTNGLIFYLDPLNLKCYPGSGTNLSSLDSSNINLRPRLTNGPTVTNGGILFDGVNDSIRVFNTDLSSFTVGNQSGVSPTSTFTIEQIFRPSFISTDNFFGLRNQLLRKGQGATTLNYWTDIDTNTIFRFYKRSDPEALRSVSFNVPDMLDKVNVVSITVNNLSVSCYYNGNFIGTQTVGGLPITSTSLDTMGIGDLGGSGTWFNGVYYNCKIYNRSLTAAEVQQNFEALRGRYNI